MTMADLKSTVALQSPNSFNDVVAREEGGQERDEHRGELEEPAKYSATPLQTRIRLKNNVKLAYYRHAGARATNGSARERKRGLKPATTVVSKT